ncbi:MAG: ATP-binding protein [Sulfurimonas sp.]|uniref:hybrid sensor histidine kinase/response regulator n=1 Tax=Sulfurimonas sp. TaxID=2022749 RepID=UPI00261F4C9B|nr:ATP-binding protein [Sulfurimonas sp.]MCW8895936.1 ATP-binding protein [Sulfurimonas sp.]MCW8953384.1 ATP-binding protein [Sulfurimonas sp.]MCW9067423.1 ATP-binding protein [Sulfurimonas sp.]
MSVLGLKSLSAYVRSAFEEDFKKADKFMLYVLFVHWIVAAFVTSYEHDTYVFGFINGGLIFAINAILYTKYSETPLFRYSVAISIILFSSIFIQQHLGRVEMHFHVFLALAILTLYKDIYPILIATVTTTIHHALFNYFQTNNIDIFSVPIKIFNYGSGWDIVSMHAIFAITEGVILALIVRMQIQNHILHVESEYNLKEEIQENKKLAKEAEQFISALNESNIISKTDISGRITYANQKFCELSGYSQEELLGKPHNIVRHPDMPAEVFKSLWDTIKSKKIFRALIKNLAKNGEEYYIDSTIIPILNVDNEIQEYIGVRYDVTEIVQAREKAILAQKAKDTFLANMSHELRTPLNSIIGFTNLADKKSDSEEVHKYLQTSLESSNILLGLINNILDISKIQSGKFSITKEPFFVYDNLLKLLKPFELESHKKDISYKYDIVMKNDLKLNGDWQRISQIIMNMISNAIKFTSEGGTVTVVTSYEHAMFTCSVIDNGIGLSEDAQNHIFNAFEQADTSTTREYGGTGLGLSISLQLAQLMDGELNMKSTLGEGSVFTLTIPLKSVDGDKKQISNNQEIDSEAREELSGHILVAEDNITNQMLIKIMIGEYGLTCDIANDGLEAIKMYSSDKYDLVLMDENMPNMSGTEAIQIIRLNHSSVVPIIVVSANTMKGDRERFFKEGADGFIAKPINEEILYGELKKFLT